jgi:hypothetical protein
MRRRLISLRPGAALRWPGAAALAGLTAITIAACGGGQGGPTVPSASGSRPGAVSHAEALHLAGQCIRQHGVPGFPDPTVDSTGQVTISKTQLLAVPKAVLGQAMTACRAALDRAGIQAGRDHGLGGRPSPQQMRAILAFARCMRAHGLTGLADPNPVNGQLSLPPGTAKTSPVVLHAQQACRSLLPGSG